MSEHGAEIAAMPPPPAHILERVEEDAGMGCSNDINEMIWTGGGKPIDLDKWLETDLESVGALDQILLAIIGSKNDFLSPTEKGAIEKKQVRRRLQQAKKYLLGKLAKRGTPAKIDEELLLKIAKRYWEAYVSQNPKDTTLWGIASDVVLPDWREKGYTHKEVDNYIKSFINAFKRDKDRRLLLVSSEGLPEVKERKAKIQNVLKLLRELGIVSYGPETARK
jgi:hypothetical protein